VIQAYIFAILSMVYIASAVSAEEEHHVHVEVKQKILQLNNFFKEEFLWII